MQVGGDAEGLQETILISVGTGTSTQAVYSSIFLGIAPRRMLK